MDLLNLFYIVITIYSDTDSIFTTKKLDDKYIGTGLGLMKDELTGNRISEMLVLDCKQYGYYYFDEYNVKHEKSVWAGVERNSLSFTEIFYMFKGGIINKIVNSRFFKSLTNLSIAIKDVELNLKFKPHKTLINNIYMPVKLYLPKDAKINNNTSQKLQYIINKIRREIKK